MSADEKKFRVPVGITKSNNSVIAVCNDGSVWMLQPRWDDPDSKVSEVMTLWAWVPMRPIPGTEAEFEDEG